MVTSNLSDTSTRLRSPIIYCKRPVSYEPILDNVLCGRIYLLTSEKDFYPCEYKRGCVPESALKISEGFYKDIANLINQEKLHNLLGVQVMDQTDQTDVELVELEDAGGGTVTFYRKDIEGEVCLRTTTWMAKEEHGVIVLKGNESHASKPGGPHKKFIDGKVM